MPLRPSQANEWINCAGAYWLSRYAPDEPPGLPAQEGSDAHEQAATAITAGHTGDTLDYNGPERLEDCVRTYVNYVSMVRIGAIAEGVETAVKLPDEFDHSGTVDYWCLFKADSAFKLSVIDLKTGYSEVPAVKNFQLLIYAWALSHELGLVKADKSYIAEVNMTIVQPMLRWGDRTKHWSIEGEQLEMLGQAINRRAREVIGGSSDLSEGAWCKYCRGKPFCPLKHLPLPKD